MDMDATKAQIVELSKLPCSVVIVGVGAADFSSMSELDGDGGPLKDARGNQCVRDIVQFVAYRDALTRGNLAEQVLKELPPQICAYLQMTNYQIA